MESSVPPWRRSVIPRAIGSAAAPAPVLPLSLTCWSRRALAPACVLGIRLPVLLPCWRPLRLAGWPRCAAPRRPRDAATVLEALQKSDRRHILRIQRRRAGSPVSGAGYTPPLTEAGSCGPNCRVWTPHFGTEEATSARSGRSSSSLSSSSSSSSPPPYCPPPNFDKSSS